jgi:4-aminobutyrate aminotransferase-like enzyme/Ser/Thr protein kinase RdoA (MazF antagonist)
MNQFSAPPLLDTATLLELIDFSYGIQGSLGRISGELDANFRLDSDDGRSLLVKISREKPEVIGNQTAAVLHIGRVDPGIPVPQPIAANDGGHIVDASMVAGASASLRVFPFIDGSVVSAISGGTAQRRAIGMVAARLGRALSSFEGKADNDALLWNLERADRIRPLVARLADDPIHPVLTKVLDAFERRIMPELPRLRRQPIHNDLNAHNILVDPKAPDQIKAIIDFGDLIDAPLINDLAIACAYQAGNPDALLGGIADVVSGYHAVTPLTPLELHLLFDLIEARWATTIAIAEWRAGLDETNASYLRRNCPRARAGLAFFAGLPREELLSTLRNVCGHQAPATANAFQPETPGQREPLIARRAARLGPAYRLFYDDPLHLVRGEGVWLYGPTGEAYLDAYNNVASVGHCHPHVVASIARQAGQLNTHTRYLHEGILNYADRLAATMPPELEQVMLTCSGSEANDLALRVARAATGNSGFIVTASAYHGVTSAVAELSPSLGLPLPDDGHVQVVPFPGQNDRSVNAASKFSNDVSAAIERLRRRGLRPAALLVDTVFMSDGVQSDASLLAGAVAAIRAAGGLFIADEVQAGFGRTGSMWGFERHCIVPDLVTLGKPMGNGHPIAGLVGRAEHLAVFGRTSRYFNTFGGNPVSCAAASAVLDVLESENLADNARVVGSYMANRLHTLALRHDIIAGIRSAGLAIGIDIRIPRRHPDAARDVTARLVNGLRQRRVLISATGARADVLKIRPPLVFSQANADMLIAALSDELEIVDGELALAA